MEKFERLLDLPQEFRLSGTLDGEARIAKMLNAHSEAIEALSADLYRLIRHVCIGPPGDEPDTVGASPIRALEEKWGCRIPPKPLRWVRTMTADEAVGIAAAEFENARGRDVRLNERLEGVRGRIIGALREHGREGE